MTQIGYQQTKEHIEKRFKSRKKNGYWKNPEKTKRKLSGMLSGYKQTEKYKRNLSKGLMGNTNR